MATRLKNVREKEVEEKITEEEASELINYINTIQGKKLELANAVLKQETIISEIREVQARYGEYDKLISHKYGSGVQIDLKTRIITKDKNT